MADGLLDDAKPFLDDPRFVAGLRKFISNFQTGPPKDKEQLDDKLKSLSAEPGFRDARYADGVNLYNQTIKDADGIEHSLSVQTFFKQWTAFTEEVKKRVGTAISSLELVDGAIANVLTYYTPKVGVDMPRVRVQVNITREEQRMNEEPIIINDTGFKMPGDSIDIINPSRAITSLNQVLNHKAGLDLIMYKPPKISITNGVHHLALSEVAEISGNITDAQDIFNDTQMNQFVNAFKVQSNAARTVITVPSLLKSSRTDHLFGKILAENSTVTANAQQLLANILSRFNGLGISSPRQDTRTVKTFTIYGLTLDKVVIALSGWRSEFIPSSIYTKDVIDFKTKSQQGAAILSQLSTGAAPLPIGLFIVSTTIGMTNDTFGKYMDIRLHSPYSYVELEVPAIDSTGDDVRNSILKIAIAKTIFAASDIPFGDSRKIDNYLQSVADTNTCAADGRNPETINRVIRALISQWANGTHQSNTDIDVIGPSGSYHGVLIGPVTPRKIQHDSRATPPPPRVNTNSWHMLRLLTEYTTVAYNKGSTASPLFTAIFGRISDLANNFTYLTSLTGIAPNKDTCYNIKKENYDAPDPHLTPMPYNSFSFTLRDCQSIIGVGQVTGTPTDMQIGPNGMQFMFAGFSVVYMLDEIAYSLDLALFVIRNVSSNEGLIPFFEDTTIQTNFVEAAEIYDLGKSSITSPKALQLFSVMCNEGSIYSFLRTRFYIASPWVGLDARTAGRAELYSDYFKTKANTLTRNYQNILTENVAHRVLYTRDPTINRDVREHTRRRSNILRDYTYPPNSVTITAYEMAHLAKTGGLTTRIRDAFRKDPSAKIIFEGPVLYSLTTGHVEDNGSDIFDFFTSYTFNQYGRTLNKVKRIFKGYDLVVESPGQYATRDELDAYEYNPDNWFLITDAKDASISNMTRWLMSPQSHFKTYDIDVSAYYLFPFPFQFMGGNFTSSSFLALPEPETHPQEDGTD